ncbi:MAG: glycosyltransferase [Chloroflexota bacterium]
MRLGIVYHRPYFQDPSGALHEAEGSFSRYVESLARRVDEVLLFVPRRETPVPGSSYVLQASNVRLVPLPFFERLPQFYRGLPRMLWTLWRQLPECDLISLRVPTPLGVWAFALARLRRRPVFLLVVGDLAGVAASVRVNNVKRLAYRVYLAIEERLQRWMVDSSPSFVNGRALYQKYNRPEHEVLLTTTSTISERDVGSREDTCQPGQPVRILCVSRVDPRKGLRYLPPALATLAQHGHDVQLTIVGPVVGTLGEEERTTTLDLARDLGIANRVQLVGPKTLLEVYAIAREHDVFVLPTLPGEGVPRVLVEAMAAGLPVVASDVAGVSTVVADRVNGLLVPPRDPDAIAAAIGQIIQDAPLRRSVIANGYTVARAHTVEAHANKIALGLVKLAGIHLHRSARKIAT